MKKRSLVAMILIIALACSVSIGGLVFSSASDAFVVDPTYKIVSPSGQGDLAKIKSDGAVTLELTPTSGYGCRVTSSELGAASLVDVKNFTTTINFTDVPVNVSTMFSLQTVAGGTVGAGNGKGINILLRVDNGDKVALAFYNQAVSEPAYWAPGQIDLDASKDLTITYNYSSATPIVVKSGANEKAVPSSLVPPTVFDEYYAATDYKAYFGISSYYFALPAKISALYTIKSINNKTPKQNYFDALNISATKLIADVNLLTSESTDEEITAVSKTNIFYENSAASKLLPIVDAESMITSKLAPAIKKLDSLSERNEYLTVKQQIEALGEALNNYNASDDASLAAAITAYEAIDTETLQTLSDEYKTELTTALNTLTQGDKFKNIIKAKTEKYIKSFEDKIDGDVSSYKTYDSINSIVATWQEYKAENHINDSLTAADIAAFDARIKAIGESVKESFYSNMWREGDSWDAQLFKKGLYVTGKGAYDETLGFNQKLELGKDTSITFNIIYALRKLGANHVHIGFYPQPQTGTRGTADGVRVDFWFSAVNTIEIKPVNGKTETPLFDAAYLSIPDTGFFDVDAETPNYEEGKYTISLSSEANALILNVNGMEMELSGLDASIFKNGCYMTISTMSAEGVEPNELLITKIGNTSYINYVKPVAPVEEEKKGCAGCGSLIDPTDNRFKIFMIFGLLAITSLLFVARRNKAK